MKSRRALSLHLVKGLGTERCGKHEREKERRESDAERERERETNRAKKRDEGNRYFLIRKSRNFILKSDPVAAVELLKNISRSANRRREKSEFLMLLLSFVSLVKEIQSFRSAYATHIFRYL